MLVKTSLAQDIDQALSEAKNTAKQNPLAVKGSIGANCLFYEANGITPRRDPFSWTFNANLTFSVFNKIAIPFTAVFTKQNQSYTNGFNNFSKPFNQFGISPRYKGITIHAGFRSVEFSEYTLSGILFLGGGVELKPQKSCVHVAAVYGQFAKAVPAGSVDGINVSVPSYERKGGGAKIKLGTDQNYGQFIFLKIKDDVNSIPYDTALIATPQENQVIAIGAKQSINKIVSVACDFAYSILTKNLYQNLYKLERFTYVNQIYATRPSSQFNTAINASIDLSPGNYKIGLKYKRIDPDYKTLGSVFLINDIEEFSLNAGTILLKNKLNINASSGLQHNNLDKIQVLTSRRIIGSLNLSYAMSKNFNLSINYSNFSSNTQAVKDVFSDTLKLMQLTQNGALSFNYSFENTDLKHNLSNSFSYMEAGGNKQSLNTFLNETFSYFLLINKIGSGISFSVIYNKGIGNGQESNESFGPNIGATKSIYKDRIKLVLNIGFTNTYVNKFAINKNKTFSCNINYLIDRNQSVKATCSLLRKEALVKNAQQFGENRISLAYVYNFGFKTKKIVI